MLLKPSTNFCLASSFPFFRCAYLFFYFHSRLYEWGEFLSIFLIFKIKYTILQLKPRLKFLMSVLSSEYSPILHYVLFGNWIRSWFWYFRLWVDFKHLISEYFKSGIGWCVSFQVLKPCCWFLVPWIDLWIWCKWIARIISYKSNYLKNVHSHHGYTLNLFNWNGRKTTSWNRNHILRCGKCNLNSVQCAMLGAHYTPFRRSLCWYWVDNRVYNHNSP